MYVSELSNLLSYVIDVKYIFVLFLIAAIDFLYVFFACFSRFYFNIAVLCSAKFCLSFLV